MILVDTSVWADHFRAGDATLAELLHRQLVLLHPFVVGELALGHLRPRAPILRNLRAAPQAAMMSNDDVLGLIEAEELVGVGIGYIDVHLLASVKASRGCRLWTRDRRLRAVAERLDLSFEQDRDRASR